MTTDFTLDVQVNIDASAGGLGLAAFRWFDDLSNHLAKEQRQELDGKPAHVAKSGTGRYAPLGESGSLFGIVTVTRGGVTAPPRTTERVCSKAGMAWFRKELSDVPEGATLEIGEFDDMGHRGHRSLVLQMAHRPESPEWVRLQGFEKESEFRDRDGQGSRASAWLEALRSYAAEFDVGYGHVAYALYDGATALEESLSRRDYPPQYYLPEYTIRECRDLLRGYSWLTIVPPGLALTLGGASAVRETGAFVEVDQLPGGGLWLVATQDFRSYGEPAMAGVFRALCPVLRPGKPLPKHRHPDESPLQLVLEDAAKCR